MIKDLFEHMVEDDAWLRENKGERRKGWVVDGWESTEVVEVCRVIVWNDDPDDKKLSSWAAYEYVTTTRVGWRWWGGFTALEDVEIQGMGVSRVYFDKATAFKDAMALVRERIEAAQENLAALTAEVEPEEEQVPEARKRIEARMARGEADIYGVCSLCGNGLDATDLDQDWEPKEETDDGGALCAVCAASHPN